MNYFWAFVVGGGLCVVGQLLIDLTAMTPARVLVGYVTAGVALSALGLYGPPGPRCPCWDLGICWPRAWPRRWPRTAWPGSSPGAFRRRPAGWRPA